MLELVSPADPSAQPVPQAPKYWAFLSYSHHDKAFGRPRNLRRPGPGARAAGLP
jgi:hypothetical protein